MVEMPAPDMVGREFVRQYYTLLHDAPEHAHRFYNSNSYFVHGSMTKPAVGQLEIHQKIQQLNFRDCHAKISQVDSQVTLGNGVVVHVSGELSNDGEPMRRFSQTFVLGTQSPKKYYVHNDIFRYQDMLQSDEEGEAAPEKEETLPEIMQEPIVNREYYPPGPMVETAAPPVMPAQQPLPVAVNAVPQIPVNVNGTGSLMHEEPLPIEPEPVVVPMEPLVAPPVMNGGSGISGDELNHRMMQPSPGLQEHVAAQLPHSGPGHLLPEEASPPKSSDSDSGNIKDDYEDESIHDQIHVSESEEQPKPTFANLLKAGRGARGMMTRGGGHPGSTTPHTAPPHSAPATFSSPEGEPVDILAPPSSSGPRPAYPDSHQIFLGKLPQDASDKELQAVFGNFGKIVELRIQPNKGSTSKAYFGFITYEDAASVQRCLSSKPIFFPKEGGRVLNVEEKKPQHKGPRPPAADSGNWHMGRGGQSGRGRGNPRGAPRGGRGSASLPPRTFPPSTRR